MFNKTARKRIRARLEVLEARQQATDVLMDELIGLASQLVAASARAAGKESSR